MTADEYRADRLTSALDQHIRDGIWDSYSIRLNGVAYEPVSDDDDVQVDDGEVVLRGPDGRLYDVDLQITVTDRAEEVEAP